MKGTDFNFETLLVEEANNHFIPIIQKKAKEINEEIEKAYKLLKEEGFMDSLVYP